jgi:hypothetical protein
MLFILLYLANQIGHALGNGKWLVGFFENKKKLVGQHKVKDK